MVWFTPLRVWVGRGLYTLTNTDVGEHRFFEFCMGIIICGFENDGLAHELRRRVSQAAVFGVGGARGR